MTSMTGRLTYADYERIAYYKEMAAAAVERVAGAATPEIRDTYLELARSWIALAEAVEKFADVSRNN